MTQGQVRERHKSFKAKVSAYFENDHLKFKFSTLASFEGGNMQTLILMSLFTNNFNLVLHIITTVVSLICASGFGFCTCYIKFGE